MTDISTTLSEAHAQLFTRIHQWQHQQSVEHFQPGAPVEVFVTAEAYGWLANFAFPPDASWQRVDEELQKMAEFVRQNRPPLANGHSCLVVDNDCGRPGLIVGLGRAVRAGWNDLNRSESGATTAESL